MSFQQCNGFLYRTIVEPGEVVCLPIGSLVIDRVLSDTTVFGYRTSFIDDAPGPLASFNQMLACLRATKPETDPLVKFWTNLKNIFPDPKASAASS